MGWPEHDQERIFVNSLKENEREGAACDHDNQQYVCRGHRECMEGQCKGSPYYSEVVMDEDEEGEYKAVMPNGDIPINEDRQKKT